MIPKSHPCTLTHVPSLGAVSIDFHSPMFTLSADCLYRAAYNPPAERAVMQFTSHAHVSSRLVSHFIEQRFSSLLHGGGRQRRMSGRVIRVGSNVRLGNRLQPQDWRRARITAIARTKIAMERISRAFGCGKTLAVSTTSSSPFATASDGGSGVMI